MHRMLYLTRCFLCCTACIASSELQADPVQSGHYPLYRQMEFSNICAIYEIWWPNAVAANEANELSTKFIALMNEELTPNIGHRFGGPKDFIEGIHFYMVRRLEDRARDKFSPIDCIAYQYYRSVENMWDKEKIDQVILDDPDFWFGSAVTQERLAAALANEVLLCFAASEEWGLSCTLSEKE